MMGMELEGKFVKPQSVDTEVRPRSIETKRAGRDREKKKAKVQKKKGSLLETLLTLVCQTMRKSQTSANEGRKTGGIGSKGSQKGNGGKRPNLPRG